MGLLNMPNNYPAYNIHIINYKTNHHRKGAYLDKQDIQEYRDLNIKYVKNNKYFKWDPIPS